MNILSFYRWAPSDDREEERERRRAESFEFFTLRAPAEARPDGFFRKCWIFSILIFLDPTQFFADLDIELLIPEVW